MIGSFFFAVNCPFWTFLVLKFHTEVINYLESVSAVLGGGLIAQHGGRDAELVEAAHGVEVEGAGGGDVGLVERRQGHAENAVDPLEVDAAGAELAGERVGHHVLVLHAVRAVVLEAVHDHAEGEDVRNVGERVVLLGAALGAGHVQSQTGQERVVLERGLGEHVATQQGVRLQVEDQQLRGAHLHAKPQKEKFRKIYLY